MKKPEVKVFGCSNIVFVVVDDVIEEVRVLGLKPFLLQANECIDINLDFGII